MIGGQGEDSCRQSGIGETPAGAEATRRLTGRPRKAKPCTETNSGVTIDPYELIHLICLPLDWRNLVMSQSHSLSVGADS
nr:hypothetical protein [Priestia megaterium]MDH3170997.1 hypothetical protein [Priestia megaterium]